MAQNGRPLLPPPRIMPCPSATAGAAWEASMTIPLVRTRYLSAYSEAYGRLGGDVKRLLREVQLAPELLTSAESYLPLRPVLRFVELAVQEVGPTLGSVAAPRRLSELGGLGHYVAGAATLRDALERFAWASRAEATGTEFVIRTQPGAVWLCRTTIPVGNDLLLAQVERYIVEAMLSLVRHWLGEAWRPDELWLQSEPWPDEGRFGELPRLRYRAPVLAFPISLQDVAATTTEPSPDPGPSLGFEATPLDRLGFVDSLTRVVETQLPLGQISLPKIAEIIGTSARTLQRRLDGHRTTFSVVLDDVRKRVALDRLRNTDATITEIAHDLGYSDSAHFARAFRRWAGISPLELRRQHRG